MTAAERLRDMARVLGDTEWGASLADELREIADGAEREARRAENPNSKLRRRRMQAHVMEVQRICAERKRRIRELNVQLAESRVEAARCSRMLGICADGEPARPAPKAVDADGVEIRVGDTMRSANGVDLTVTKVMESTSRPGGWTVVGTTGRHGVTSFFASELTHRAPALDADGVEISVGDRCYVASDGDGPYVVYGIRESDGAVDMHLVANDNDHLHIRPDLITHRAPVLAEDGKPLLEGETVWGKDGFEWVVVDTDVSFMPGCVQVRGSGAMSYANPSQLTHERPDSWERLEEDAVKSTTEYWRCPVAGCDHCSAKVDGEKPWERFGTYGNCNDAKELDLVRRCKALAERGK